MVNCLICGSAYGPDQANCPRCGGRFDLVARPRVVIGDAPSDLDTAEGDLLHHDTPPPMMRGVAVPAVSERSAVTRPLRPGASPGGSGAHTTIEAEAPKASAHPEDDARPDSVIMPTTIPPPSAVTVRGAARTQVEPLSVPKSALRKATDNLPPTPPPLQPKLVVVRGERLNTSYAIIEGKNYIGRTADRPVDIDLEGQEPAERIWTSRQHAVITFECNALLLEDLNSLNGTFVNRERLRAGQVRHLRAGDVIQVGTVQLKVVV